MIRLIIKGSVPVAEQAASDRGIELLGARPASPKATYQTVGYVFDRHEHEVIKWFLEPGGVVRGQGYEPGTLLLF